MAKEIGYKLTYGCDDLKYNGTQVVGGVKQNNKLAFSCAYCGVKLLPVLAEMRFTAHGRTANAVKHTLKQVQELG